MFIQITLLGDPPARGAWAVSVHNPTDDEIVARCRIAFAVPGLDIEDRDYVVPAGSDLSLTD
jgi:hypothetical protein